MATTSFAGRRPQYIESYARTVSSYQRYQDIARDIQVEQDRVNYLDSLMASERQNLTNLNEVFRVRPQDLGSAQALLQQQYAGEDAARRRVASGAAGRAAGLRLPKAVSDQVKRDLAANKPIDARNTALGAITADTTPEQGSELLSLLATGGLEAKGIAEVRGQLQRVAKAEPQAEQHEQPAPKSRP